MKMNRFYIVLILIAMVVSSCNKKQLMPKPSNLIPYDNMVVIIADSYVIESMVYYLSPDSDKVAITKSLYYDLFNKNNITKEQFTSSISYYLAEKSSAEKLLKSVSDNIAERRKLYVDEPEETENDEFSIQ
jgi:hypothetical protein